MKAGEKPVVAVDVGGTKFIAAVVDRDGAMLSRVYYPTNARQGPEAVISRLVSTIHKSIGQSGVGIQNIGGVSLAIAGIVDINRGMVIESPNLPDWHDVHLDSLLQGEFRMPVFLLNDANAAALGEHCFGGWKRANNLIYITVSTGIGGGFIINGELYNGTDGCAAEIGHMVILADGPACSCGRRGCLEALVSGTAIARMARERLSRGESSIMMEMVRHKPASLTAEHVTIAGRKHDAVALSIIHEAARYFGIGLANLVNLFNPNVIVIGGGVSAMGEMLFRPARKTMREQSFKLPAATARIVKSKLNPDSGILGAAAYARIKLGGLR